MTLSGFITNCAKSRKRKSKRFQPKKSDDKVEEAYLIIICKSAHAKGAENKRTSFASPDRTNGFMPAEGFQKQFSLRNVCSLCNIIISNEQVFLLFAISILNISAYTLKSAEKISK